MRKAIVGALSAMLVLSLGAGSAFAASAGQGHTGKCARAVWSNGTCVAAETGIYAYRELCHGAREAQKSGGGVAAGPEDAGGKVTWLRQAGWDQVETGSWPDTCRYGFVDANGDGLCDHTGGCALGPDYVDADGDGICGNAGTGRGNGYVDNDGDGVCDNLGGGTRPQDGTGYQYGNGHCGGRHHGGRWD